MPPSPRREYGSWCFNVSHLCDWCTTFHVVLYWRALQENMGAGVLMCHTFVIDAQHSMSCYIGERYKRIWELVFWCVTPWWLMHNIPCRVILESVTREYGSWCFDVSHLCDWCTTFHVVLYWRALQENMGAGVLMCHTFVIDAQHSMSCYIGERYKRIWELVFWCVTPLWLMHNIPCRVILESVTREYGSWCFDVSHLCDWCTTFHVVLYWRALQENMGAGVLMCHTFVIDAQHSMSCYIGERYKRIWELVFWCVTPLWLMHNIPGRVILYWRALHDCVRNIFPLSPYDIIAPFWCVHKINLDFILIHYV